ncbi:immunity 49 family protein [Streptomyces sp. NRRL F-4489]|uniref:immunity 49 family protein n=1 Tax=Streptomyces sp. NRRL F-4489 TaxID=1609095 RepID=UPI002D21A079|nr:immunity 49 family protein [Streptomyces sp. NRRL F-4489]
MEESPEMLDGALDKAMLHVQARLAVNSDASALETWEAVVTAMQVGSAMFAVAARTEGTVECRIAEEMRTLRATGPRLHANPGNWITAFWLAVVCREQDRMTQLCEIPVEALRASGTEYDEFIYLWIDALQTYWLERPGLIDKLVAAIEASYPEHVQVADMELMEKILYQPVNLFHRFLRKDREGFNQALFEALELHKAYWTATEKRESSVAGYLALGPLAIACLAYDAGFPITVESDYLPSELLNRAWLGEFPT